MPFSILRKALFLSVLVLIATSLHAQTTGKLKRRPNIPGSIIVDFGFNGTQNSPVLWRQTFFGSRTVNIYYQYPLRFGRSNFSFNPGIGLSMERFKWKTNIVLTDPAETGTQVPTEKYEFANAERIYDDPRKLMLVNNYLEVPLEFRYDSKPEDISRSFNIAIGARGGWMYDSFMKIKYKQDGQTKKLKDKQDFGLTQLRYGVYTRIGMGGFNVFCFYNLTPLFQKNMGPYDKGSISEGGAIVGSNASGTAMTTFTAGISLNAF